MSTLVGSMAWWLIAPKHHLNQCWLWHGISRTQWVHKFPLQPLLTTLWPGDVICWIKLGQHWLKQWLVAWQHQCTKPLPESMLTNHQWGLRASTWGGITPAIFKNPKFKQSGTKPNLVAKIWPPNLVTICAWLPKLVANVSYNFHHLVNTGLAVGSFFKWLPITVAHTCKLDTIWVVYISPIGNGSIRLQSPWTYYALWNFTSSGAGHFGELAGAHT